MRSFIAAYGGGLLWLPIFAIAQQPLQSSILDVERDRFTGTISLTGKQNPATEVADVAPLGAVSAGATTTEISLLIIVQHEDWQYLKCNDVHWLVDGKPLPLPAATHSGDVGRSYVLEFLAVNNISLASLERLATAQNIEFKICNDEFTVAPKRISEIRELAKLMPIAINEARAKANP